MSRTSDRSKKRSPASGRFGQALRQLRTEKGVKLRDLSEQIGVSLPYLSDVERGRRDPLSNSRIQKVAEILGVNPLPLLEVATKERGRIVIDLNGQDDHRVQAAIMLSLVWPTATDALVGTILQVTSHNWFRAQIRT